MTVQFDEDDVEAWAGLIASTLYDHVPANKRRAVLTRAIKISKAIERGMTVELDEGSGRWLILDGRDGTVIGQFKTRAAAWRWFDGMDARSP